MTTQDVFASRRWGRNAMVKMGYPNKGAVPQKHEVQRTSDMKTRRPGKHLLALSLAMVTGGLACRESSAQEGSGRRRPKPNRLRCRAAPETWKHSSPRQAAQAAIPA